MQAVEHLNSSRPGLACVEFDAIERASRGSVERVLAAFNLGVAAATAGELSRAEAAFTRALAVLSAEGASRDITKVHSLQQNHRTQMIPGLILENC